MTNELTTALSDLEEIADRLRALPDDAHLAGPVEKAIRQLRGMEAGAATDDRFTNARLAYALNNVRRLVDIKLGSLVQGMWNPRFCAADAHDAADTLATIRDEIQHWEDAALRARAEQGEG